MTHPPLARRPFRHKMINLQWNSVHLKFPTTAIQDKDKAVVENNMRTKKEDQRRSSARKPNILIPSFRSLQEAESKAMNLMILAASASSPGMAKHEEKVNFMLKVSPIASRQRKLSLDGSTSSVESVRSHLNG